MTTPAPTPMPRELALRVALVLAPEVKKNREKAAAEKSDRDAAPP